MNKPHEEMPRERLVQYGSSSLSNTELLAILLRVGVKNLNVLELANNVLMKYENIQALNEATVSELKEIRGMGQTKAISLIAAIELGKRINTPNSKKRLLTNHKEVYDFMKNQLQMLKHEEFWVLYLDIKGNLIEKKILSKGATNQVYIDIKEICKWAIKNSSSGVILVHNHPSGDPSPSSEDKEITKAIIKSLKMLNIAVCDHIIIGHNKYVSFKKDNILKKDR